MALDFIFVIVFILILFDLGLFNRKNEEISLSKSFKLSALYIALGLLFSLFVFWQLGAGASGDYLTAYIIEKTLALDNIFVIALIFSGLQIPRAYQHRVLYWGIIGVIVLRALMIGLGTAIVAQYHFILYFFAAFLIYTGLKLLVFKEKPQQESENSLIKFFKKHLRITDKLYDNRFLIKLPHQGKDKYFATPLLLSLLVIEFSDIIFAFDSIPAVFTITTDPFIAYTSNIFAILGLRALFFSLSAMLNRFIYLKYALSVLLIFIGSKMFISYFLGLEKFPLSISLSLTFLILACGVIFSIFKTRKKAKVSNYLKSE